MKFVNVARCPTHGLHGERTECFICGGQVEQVRMVEVPDDLRQIGRDIWVEGPAGVALILEDHDALLRALRRIHDATGAEDEGRPTSLGYIREQARAALARHTNAAFKDQPGPRNGGIDA